MRIYKITNLINQKVYIGLETGGELSRWKSHLQNYKRYQQAIHSAMRKYGPENFTCDIIDTADNIVNLIKKEVKWIQHYQSYGPAGYNNSPGGEVAVVFDELGELLIDTELNQIRSQLMTEVNNKRWGKLSDEEKKEFVNTHLHSIEADQKRSKTIKQKWDNMSEEEKNFKLRGLKTHWLERSYEEKCQMNERKNGLFSRKKWKITDENGNEEIVIGLGEFCREHNFLQQSFRHYANSGKRYKGFLLERIEE